MERVHANEKTQLMKSFIQQKAESIKWKEKYRIEQKEKLDLKELLEKEKEAFEKEKEKFEIEKALLENEKKDLERKLLDSTPKQHVNNYLSAVFTPGQIKRLLDPSKKRIVWNPEDISAAMSAGSYGARAYHYWRTKRNMPLPGMSTLRKWAGSFCFEPGVLKPVMDHMKLKSSQLPSIEKLAVLSFDEIHISQQIEIDKKKRASRKFFLRTYY
jgi:hypothetical protein